MEAGQNTKRRERPSRETLYDLYLSEHGLFLKYVKGFVSLATES